MIQNLCTIYEKLRVGLWLPWDICSPSGIGLRAGARGGLWKDTHCGNSIGYLNSGSTYRWSGRSGAGELYWWLALHIYGGVWCPGCLQSTGWPTFHPISHCPMHDMGWERLMRGHICPNFAFYSVFGWIQGIYCPITSIMIFRLFDQIVKPTIALYINLKDALQASALFF